VSKSNRPLAQGTVEAGTGVTPSASNNVNVKFVFTTPLSRMSLKLSTRSAASSWNVKFWPNVNGSVAVGKKRVIGSARLPSQVV